MNDIIINQIDNFDVSSEFFTSISKELPSVYSDYSLVVVKVEDMRFISKNGTDSIDLVNTNAILNTYNLDMLFSSKEDDFTPLVRINYILKDKDTIQPKLLSYCGIAEMVSSYKKYNLIGKIVFKLEYTDVKASSKFNLGDQHSILFEIEDVVFKSIEIILDSNTGATVLSYSLDKNNKDFKIVSNLVNNSPINSNSIKYINTKIVYYPSIYNDSIGNIWDKLIDDIDIKLDVPKAEFYTRTSIQSITWTRGTDIISLIDKIIEYIIQNSIDVTKIEFLNSYTIQIAIPLNSKARSNDYFDLMYHAIIENFNDPNRYYIMKYVFNLDLNKAVIADLAIQMANLIMGKEKDILSLYCKILSIV